MEINKTNKELRHTMQLPLSSYFSYFQFLQTNCWLLHIELENY